VNRRSDKPSKGVRGQDCLAALLSLFTAWTRLSIMWIGLPHPVDQIVHSLTAVIANFTDRLMPPITVARPPPIPRDVRASVWRDFRSLSVCKPRLLSIYSCVRRTHQLFSDDSNGSRRNCDDDIFSPFFDSPRQHFCSKCRMSAPRGW